MGSDRRTFGSVLVVLGLSAVVLVLFQRLASFPFIEVYDDNVYVIDNPAVRAGLSWGGLRWAFKTTYAANWHPLTWLSHMTDVTLFGLQAGRHHEVNVALHAANTALVFLVLQSLTGAPWRSGFAAVLFAVHPLHVESVAWVAERKDVLSAQFFLLALLTYGRYARRRSWGRYAAVAACFALGLLSKPMVVTLPFVLLLLDFWPLGRFPRVPARVLIGEKAPLFALTAASCAATYAAQSAGGTVASELLLPFGVRLANAVAAYGAYLGKTVWPAPLSVIYPHLSEVAGRTGWLVAAAAVALVGLTALAVWQGRRRPHLALGWFWYLGTLVPVIGLVQVGSQAMADRYTYLPLIGIFVLAAWEFPRVHPTQHLRRAVLGAAGATIAAAFALTAWAQVSYWRSSTALFTRALETASRTWVARNNLGLALAHQGEPQRAIEQYRRALEIRPEEPTTLVNLGMALLSLGRFAEAAGYLDQTVRLRPDFFVVRANLGYVLLRLGRLDEAAVQLWEALRRNPADTVARRNLNLALAAGARTGRGRKDP